jgi:hypothetical protein
MKQRGRGNKGEKTIRLKRCLGASRWVTVLMQWWRGSAGGAGAGGDGDRRPHA